MPDYIADKTLIYSKKRSNDSAIQICYEIDAYYVKNRKKISEHQVMRTNYDKREVRPWHEKKKKRYLPLRRIVFASSIQLLVNR